jgi:hypothetical protein
MASANRWRLCVFALTIGAALVGCSTWSQPPPRPLAGPPPSGTLGETTVTERATVKKLDLQERMLTLERADGTQITFRVSEDVRNLPQVRVGDVVTATFYESISYAVKAPNEGTLGTTVNEQNKRAEPEQKSSMSGSRTTIVTSRIAKIDKLAGTVTIQAAGGDTLTVKARDPKNLDRIAVGDLVDMTLTEAVAISVDAPHQ